LSSSLVDIIVVFPQVLNYELRELHELIVK